MPSRTHGEAWTVGSSCGQSAHEFPLTLGHTKSGLGIVNALFRRSCADGQSIPCFICRLMSDDSCHSSLSHSLVPIVHSYYQVVVRVIVLVYCILALFWVARRTMPRGRKSAAC
ncbi:MAG TPA: hypothetical protein VFC84_02265 [Desulfosporosinus sp.]|nr:hypothetical protein [Desulfosporosinus sp.]